MYPGRRMTNVTASRARFLRERRRGPATTHLKGVIKRVPKSRITTKRTENPRGEWVVPTSGQVPKYLVLIWQISGLFTITHQGVELPKESGLHIHQIYGESQRKRNSERMFQISSISSLFPKLHSSSPRSTRKADHERGRF
jgi:hypothetical protein